MNKKRYRTSLRSRIMPYLIFAVLFSFVLYFVITGLDEASAGSDAEGLRIAERSITRSVINCYASEGKYPPSFEYLKEHYGISIDENKYIVHYEIFAENFMPDITVLKYER